MTVNSINLRTASFDEKMDSAKGCGSIVVPGILAVAGKYMHVKP